MSSQLEEISFDTWANALRGNHCCFLLRLPPGMGDQSGQEAVTLHTAEKAARCGAFWDSQKTFFDGSLHCWWTLYFCVIFDVNILNLFRQEKKSLN